MPNVGALNSQKCEFGVGSDPLSALKSDPLPLDLSERTQYHQRQRGSRLDADEGSTAAPKNEGRLAPIQRPHYLDGRARVPPLVRVEVYSGFRRPGTPSAADRRGFPFSSNPPPTFSAARRGYEAGGVGLARRRSPSGIPGEC